MKQAGCLLAIAALAMLGPAVPRAENHDAAAPAEGMVVEVEFALTLAEINQAGDEIDRVAIHHHAGTHTTTQR